MKVDVDCINHNVFILTDELASQLYDLQDEHQKDMTLGEIHGIILLAENLKEVLKS